jgi:hypothetical protein
MEAKVQRRWGCREPAESYQDLPGRRKMGFFGLWFVFVF